jgi:hypothetical protein
MGLPARCSPVAEILISLLSPLGEVLMNQKGLRFLLAQTPAIVEAGARAAVEAVRQAKSKGLNIHYIENGCLIEETPGGERRVLKPLDPVEE